MLDIGAILEEEVNSFWRENITTIPSGLLVFLDRQNFTRESIREVVGEHIQGKKYFNYDKDKNYSFCEEDHQKIITELEQVEKEEEKLKKELHSYIQNNESTIRQNSEKNRHAKKAGFHQYKNADQLIKDILDKKKSGYVQELYADILMQCDDCSTAEDKRKKRIQQVIDDINCQAINVVSTAVNEFKLRNNLLSFDDMIINLHRALNERSNEKLVTSLQQKYKAIFVDEFQDTDRLQYDIFQKAFGTNTTLFYIGDPKQSIYAFRKADIFTYFKAKEEVQHLYTMNRNFRSSADLIQAMNLFFEPHPGFDTFHFDNATEAITYRAVMSPEPNTRGALIKDGVAVVPVSITDAPKNDQIVQSVAAQVIELLSNPAYKITKNGEERSITPSDIGILVRTGNQAKDIKSKLAFHSVPAVTIDETKVLDSEEAKYLLNLLEAMVNTSRSSINKALLSPFTNYKYQQILHLNDETTLALFRKYRILWQDDGVFSALMDFIADFNVKAVLLSTNTENGERIIANLFQLVEIVHKVQTNKQFSPPELVNWLKKGIEGKIFEGDEYEQRVESDEESIKIITIHRSKGLEYNIVFAPFLDLVENDTRPLHSYRDPATGEYISVEKGKADDQMKVWIQQQNEQENRRLVYVALTRAVYKCYLHHSTHYRYDKSTLSFFLNALGDADPLLVKKEDTPLYDHDYRFLQEDGYQPLIRETPVHFVLEHNNWTKMSYTMLAQKGEIISRPAGGTQPGKYDQFIFSQLARGSKTGNLLHQIFEQADFMHDHNWKYVINEALQQHLPKQRDLYAPLLHELLKKTFSVPIHVSGQTFMLSEVSYENRIHEFEFDFPVPQYNPADFNRLTNPDVEVRVSWDKPLEGVMNGKMDLFFSCRDKYYILDWKSNYLGDTLSDYSPKALARAMNENNYHLQYLLYTFAAKKYLQSRLKDFEYGNHFGGVIYLFVRGVRSNGKHGIYVRKPTEQQLEMLEKVLGGEEVLEGKKTIKATQLNLF